MSEKIAECRGLGWKQPRELSRERIEAGKRASIWERVKLPPTLPEIMRASRQELFILAAAGLTVVAACLVSSPDIDGKVTNPYNSESSSIQPQPQLILPDEATKPPVSKEYKSTQEIIKEKMASFQENFHKMWQPIITDYVQLLPMENSDNTQGPKVEMRVFPDLRATLDEVLQYYFNQPLPGVHKDFLMIKEAENEISIWAVDLIAATDENGGKSKMGVFPVFLGGKWLFDFATEYDYLHGKKTPGEELFGQALPPVPRQYFPKQLSQGTTL